MIEVRISKSGRDAAGTVRPLVADLVETAKVMAEALKASAMADTRKVSFDTRKPSSLSDEYMRLLGSRFGNKSSWAGYASQGADKEKPNLRLGEKGWVWRNSDLWHKIARKDDATFNRTGGMWAGLRVRNYGAKGAIIEFAGRSEGQTGEWKAGRGRTKSGQQRKQKWSGKVSNNLKAWTVLQEKKVLLLEPDDKTQQALELAVNDFVARWVAGELGGKVTVSAGGNSLSARFLSALG